MHTSAKSANTFWFMGSRLCSLGSCGFKYRLGSVQDPYVPTHMPFLWVGCCCMRPLFTLGLLSSVLLCLVTPAPLWLRAHSDRLCAPDLRLLVGTDFVRCENAADAHRKFVERSLSSAVFKRRRYVRFAAFGGQFVPLKWSLIQAPHQRLNTFDAVRPL